MNLVNINVGTAVSIAIRASSSLTLTLYAILFSLYQTSNTKTTPNVIPTQYHQNDHDTNLHPYIYLYKYSSFCCYSSVISKGDTKILNNLALGWEIMWYFLVKCFYVCTSSNSESNTSICFWWIYSLNVTQYNHNTNY